MGLWPGVTVRAVTVSNAALELPLVLLYVLALWSATVPYWRVSARVCVDQARPPFIPSSRARQRAHVGDAHKGCRPELVVASLVDIYTVVRILGEGMRESSIKSWMMGSNPRLKGKAPIEAIHDGRAYEVMGTARAFVTRR